MPSVLLQASAVTLSPTLTASQQSLLAAQSLRNTLPSTVARVTAPTLRSPSNRTSLVGLSCVATTYFDAWEILHLIAKYRRDGALHGLFVQHEILAGGRSSIEVTLELCDPAVVYPPKASNESLGPPPETTSNEAIQLSQWMFGANNVRRTV